MSFRLATLEGRAVLVTDSGVYDLERRAANHYSLQLQRLDHDWRFRIGISFNMITDDTTFYFDFEPTLGGLIRTRNERLYGRQRHFRQRGFDY